jgi:hypothetical protein
MPNASRCTFGRMLRTASLALAIIEDDGKRVAVRAYDDDSNCMADVIVPSSVDAIALTKELLRILPVK